MKRDTWVAELPLSVQSVWHSRRARIKLRGRPIRQIHIAAVAKVLYYISGTQLGGRIEGNADLRTTPQLTIVDVCIVKFIMSSELHFLVVNDFSTMRKIVIRLLKEIGYNKVSEADGSESALRLLNAELASPPVDFIITDWNLPVIDGLGFLRSVRESAKLRQLPVLMISAEAKKSNVIAAAQAGADGYIVKPFSAATLKGKLDEILAKKKAGALSR